MIALRRLAVALAVVAAPLACKHTPAATDVAKNDMLFAVAWVQTSAEYEASALQAYGAAGPALERALADTAWTAAVEQQGDFSALPPAIIVDIDETVLDNSAYQARLIASGGEFAPDTWNAWIEEREATGVPGAAAFLSAAAAKGVRVFYVSNRDLAQAEATRDNLARLGFPDVANLDTFYFRDPDRGWKEKSPRRAEVAKKHRVVLMFGDNLFDFVDKDHATLVERAALVREHAAWWGTRWFVLPNPMYGSWDDALFNYDRTKTPAQKQQLRLQSLDPAE
ncbi:5'-nucleotidase, lipoprotein e(P4) family [Nannocystis pusilla]|uniref:5'-nucleotidase, lipoprotein e(P4) family n=1 Tax=Nannocystis pusilla TaxID=889268 RepID=UPI003BF24AD1